MSSNYQSPAVKRHLPEPSPSAIDLGEAFNYLSNLAEKRFFGVVQLSFQSGQLLNVRSEQSFKSSDIHNLVATSKGVSSGAKNS